LSKFNIDCHLYSNELVKDINNQYFLTLGRCTVNIVEKYNPASDTWCEVSPMATPCRGLGAGILEGILYAVGGSDGIAALNRVGSLASGMHLSFACATVHSIFSLGLYFLSRILMTTSISPPTYLSSTYLTALYTVAR